MNNSPTYLLLCVLLLFSGLILAQSPQKHTYQEAQVHFDHLTQISDFPEDQLYPETQSAWLAVQSKGDYSLSLLYLTSDSTYLLTHTLEDLDLDFPCRGPEAFYEEGQVLSECRWMRGLMFGVRLEVKKHRLILIEEFDYDLNEENYDSAAYARKINDPLLFCHAYLGMQYYTDVHYRALEAIVWADSLAFAFYQRGEFEEAAKLMRSMQTECDLSFSEWAAETDLDAFKMSWGNAAHYYLKAGYYAECIEVCKWLLQRYPSMMRVHLQYADALFEIGKQEEARKQYQVYADNMQAAGKGEKIPSRVTDRLLK